MDHEASPLDRNRRLESHDLRSLSARHDVCFEIGPYHIVKEAGALARHGWVVDLYAHRAETDLDLRDREISRHLHEVLGALARAALPGHDGLVAVELEHETGAIRLDPHRGFREEVRLRIVVEPLTTAPESELLDADTTCMHDLTSGLEQLGCRRR